MEEIDSKELVRRTGASYRQIHYWTTRGTIDELHPFGNRMMFDPTIVKRVKLMVKIQNDFNGSVPSEILRQIYDRYYRGNVDLGGGIMLTWEVEPDAPSS